MNDGAVLLLNQNYEPLNVCNLRRAMVMILGGKAEILENGRGFIHSVSHAWPIPSVIRLGYMIRRPLPRVRLCRKEVFRRDNYTCQYCGRRTHSLTMDHVVPRHRGGDHVWENLISACPTCNRFKGDYWPTPEASPDLMLLHPQQDDLSAHVESLLDGRLIGLTKRGWFHIQRLRLNRVQLIELRLQRAKEQRLRQTLEHNQRALRCGQGNYRHLRGDRNIRPF